MIKNRLRHVPDDVFQKFLAFSEEHPDVVPPAYMLQKLTIFDFIQPIAAAEPHAEILEIGCGTGVHSALLSRIGHVTASELAVPGSFAGAEKDVDHDRNAVFGALANGPVEFVYNDGKSVPFPDESFDFVFHNSVIEHVDDPVRFNREVARVLRPNGVAVCITGTPMFCAFRLTRQMLFLPPILLRSLFRELRAPAAQRKVSDEFRRFATDEAEKPPTPVDIRALYTRLAHFLESPEYNRVLLDNIAAAEGISVESLLAAVVDHFERSALNRMLFKFSPPTHGQHYRGVFDEMKQWNIQRWVDRAEAVGLATESVIPFRYHHFFEPTINTAFNSRLYHRFAELIHKANELHVARPDLASEFILVSRKNAGSAAAA